jgi:hypothetical protein
MSYEIPSIPSVPEMFNLPASITSPVLVGSGGLLETSGLTTGTKGARDMMGDTHIRTPSQPSSAPKPSSAPIVKKVEKSAQPVSGTTAGIKKVTTPAKVRTPSTPVTPASRAGLRYNYSGYYNGIVYLNGYVVSISIPKPAPKPAIKKGR